MPLEMLIYMTLPGLEITFKIRLPLFFYANPGSSKERELN